MARLSTAPLLLALSFGLASAQDPGPQDRPQFLEGDAFTCTEPPLRLSRPHDAWQFLDLEAIKAKRRADGLSLEGYGTLKFQLWFGAARADVLVHAWTNPQKISLELASEHLRGKIIDTIRDGEVKASKKVRVGKQVGTWFEITGNIPDPKDKTKLKAIVIFAAAAYREADRALVTVEMQFAADSERGGDLAKDFKKLLKKAKF